MQISAVLKKYFPLAAGVVILAVIGFLAPWQEIGELLGNLTPDVVLELIGLSALYYAAKIVRFWIMLAKLDAKRPLLPVALAYLSAQPVSLLPAGELYRTVTLERYADVPVKQSAPTVTLQGLLEGVILLIFALIGSFALGRNRLAVVVVAVGMFLLLMGLRQGWFHGQHRLLNRLPFVTINGTSFRKFMNDHQKLLRGSSAVPILLISLIPIMAGIAIVHVSAGALGSHLSWAQASIAYCLPVILSGLSMLPGGLGASEGGTIGLLHLMNVATPAAVAITLLVRLSTLGAGLVYGGLGVVAAHFVYGDKA